MEETTESTNFIIRSSSLTETSLFQTLAGRVSSDGKIVVEGNIYLGGVKIDPHDQEHRKLLAYVSQEDSLHESSTPREALTFSAKLRLPKTMTDEDIEKIVNRCLDELGLGSAADTIIGGGLKKGISGGEKRRVSIGVELVASPSIIFMDEPTSGLDSYAAAQVMKLLDRVAKAGNTVLFTIHQPSSNIFAMFDRLILLNKGQVMYQGDVLKLGEDFAKYGHPVPANYNPADWVVDVAQTQSIEDMEISGFFAKEPSDYLTSSSATGELALPERNPVSMWQEFKMLQQREMRNLQRNPTPMIINVGLTSVLSVIFGVIFLDVGRQDRSDFSVRFWKTVFLAITKFSLLTRICIFSIGRAIPAWSDC
jgi:ABC-type multidrug transport system ATPase subunit